ncbi:MAG: type II toxin-antitoxin system prevent-host-death family antitoxin [Planctomycetota bacterium]
MKSVSINDLKRNLSGYLDEAVRGDPIVVTRHRRPWAKLSAADVSHVREGSRIGQVELEPVLANPLPEAARHLLADDREDSTEHTL